MQKLVLEAYNQPLVLRETTSEVLLPNQIRVKTAFSGLSFTDSIIQKGLYKYQKKHWLLPCTPGFEASGVVSEVGIDIKDTAVGDNVAAFTHFGCFAEEIIVTEAEIMKVPHETDLAWVASLPVNFFTAYHALNQLVVLPPHGRVLVESAAGGVGGMLVQLASKHHEVVGLVSNEEKRCYVKHLGAETVATYRELATLGQFDAIFTAEGSRLDAFRQQLRPGGKLICYGFHELVPTTTLAWLRSIALYLQLPRFKVGDLVHHNQTISGFNIIHLQHNSWQYQEAKEAFCDLLAAGRQGTQHEVPVFSVNDYQKAFAALEDRSRVGKVVLRWG